MIQVLARRIITRPMFQVIENEVIVNGFYSLTPRAARAALEIAFGNSNSGEVWCADYGYKIYAKSARKIRRDNGND